MAQGYPPNGEAPSFLDLGVALENARIFLSKLQHQHFAFCTEFGGCLAEETLDHVLGEVEAKMKRSPSLEAAIDSVEGMS
ncbi:UNVERIFIED_CONTAM: hypothetical protein Sangu_1708400 [Sesamum angustifolium]|uniref:Uncharacterized protein n=1 Tax=Sesamum angustifolium TaxID=2727405 RepID=A0AAW2MLG9_9LAMI